MKVFNDTVVNVLNPARAQPTYITVSVGKASQIVHAVKQ